MDATWIDDGIVVAGDARQRFYDARGYGDPMDDGRVKLTPVEAAHLLYRDDLESVDGMGFAAFLRSVDTGDILPAFVVYKDFRERGYYLRPIDSNTFAVFERGSDPTDGTIAYRVRVIDERSRLGAGSLDPGVLAIVDEEGEVGYVSVEQHSPAGTSVSPTWEGVRAELIGQRVIVPDPPVELYTRCFFGQPLGGRNAFEDVLQLSLVEARYLTESDVLSIDGGIEAIDAMGQALEGERFGRRATAYRALREAGTVPKTGYKFGADFRLYRSFESIEEMSHSDQLVRVMTQDTILDPQAIALDVRLAHGVGKRMVFARSDDKHHRSIDWLSIDRLTP